MRYGVTVAAAVAALFFMAAPAGASSGSKITKHDWQVLRFFQHHPKLARTSAGGAALAAVLPHVAAVARSLQDAITQASSSRSLSGDWPGPPWPVPPAWFQHDAACIEMGESTDGAGSSNLYGMLDGWSAAGGTDSAWAADQAEQLYRVWVLYNMDGWSPWATAPGCGL